VIGVQILASGMASVVEVEDPNGDAAAIRDLIGGGWLEGVRLPSWSAFMFVDEEGALKGLPGNRAASVLAGRPIVGDVVIFGDDRSPDVVDAPRTLLRALGLVD
jgi:hypothetical protein